MPPSDNSHALDHLVLVLFENRSFDNVLGMLANVDGVDTSFENRYDDLRHVVKPSNTVASGNSPFITPFPDPAEFMLDMRQQIFNGESTPNMKGFAENYFKKTKGTPGDVMFYFTPEQLPVSNFLGETFAVSDRYFASGPVQTLPNRMFSICGTSGTDLEKNARINDTQFVDGSVTATSIFDLLDDAGGTGQLNWKVYFHDTSLSRCHRTVDQAFNDGTGNVASFDLADYNPPYGTTFFQDLENDALPPFSIIEPRYYNGYAAKNSIPNSNHPGNGGPFNPDQKAQIDVRYGELLLLNVVAGLLAYPDICNKTLLIVTYDENGGIFDHVPPPAGVSPFSPKTHNGDVFDSYGVRVPAIFINPSIKGGTVYEPPAAIPFDHTSILSTVCAQFGLPVASLGARTQSAPAFANLIAANATARTVTISSEVEKWAAGIPVPKTTPGPPKHD